MRGVASEKAHCCDPFFRADTLFTPHDYRYSATHEGRDANRHVQTGTKIMSPPIAWTNMTSVSKATRAGTSRQHNIASALCAHAVAMEKREANRANIVARPVGHARSRLRIRSGALSMGVERAHKSAAALDEWYAA